MFDRAEIARVMNAAGQRRDALPQDLQKGIDLGLVSPEVLQNFFDLRAVSSDFRTHFRFPGFQGKIVGRSQILAQISHRRSHINNNYIVSAIRKAERKFFQELDYVITDTVRGSVVDFLQCGFLHQLCHSFHMLMR